MIFIPGWGRSHEEGNGSPLQYSCLENPMDGGAWWATVHGVTKSRTWLSVWAPNCANTVEVNLAKAAKNFYKSMCLLSQEFHPLPDSTICLSIKMWKYNLKDNHLHNNKYCVASQLGRVWWVVMKYGRGAILAKYGVSFLISTHVFPCK